MNINPRETGAWKQALRQVPIFSGLDETALADIANACIRRVIVPGTYLFFEGDPGRCLFVIERGVLQIRKETDGEPLIVAERGAGEAVGEMALLDGNSRSATAVAKTKTVLYELSRDEFLERIRRRPELALKMLEVLAHRLREADNRTALRLRTVGDRLVSFLWDRAQQEATNDMESQVICLGNLTNAEIGRQIGAKRETVSREMALLEQKEVVERKGRDLWIRDSVVLNNLRKN